MSYTQDLTLVQLAEHYHRYQDVACLQELKRREASAKLEDVPDNQLVFDFHKDQVVSASQSTNNQSVKDDPWKDAYEAGFRAGVIHGAKQAQEVFSAVRQMAEGETLWSE